ncbi:protein FAM114A2-like, partial [Trifolium medium]|nr:protein FAM114A2-like [Trifolium medium]
MCCFAVSQLLTFGKSIISLANKTEDEEVDDDKVNIEWPEDVSAKAKIIRINVQTMI